MKKIMVIADDLTGACDTGIKFTQKGYKTRVIMPKDGDFSIQDESVEVFSITTDTRNCTSEEAKKIINKLLDFYGGNYHFYKKIDSVLRGNIISELDVFIERGYAKKAIICPSYVEEGRTLKNGVLRICKSEGEANFNVGETLGLESWGYISLKTVRKGYEAVVKKVRNISEKYILVDSITNEDLQIIAEACEVLTECIPAGSAGLARYYYKPLIKPKKIEKKKINDGGIPLIVVGTKNPITVNQVKQLKKMNNLEVYLVYIASDGVTVTHTEILEKKINKEGILLTTNLVYFNEEKSEHLLYMNFSNENIKQIIAKEATSIYGRNNISSIISTGGDTSSCVLESLGLNRIDLIEEIILGIPYGIASSSDGNKIKIVTKSGGFGKEDALVKLYEYMR